MKSFLIVIVPLIGFSIGCSNSPVTPNPGVLPSELSGTQFMFDAGLEGADKPGNAALSGSALYAPRAPIAFGLNFFTAGYGGSAVVKYQILGHGTANAEQGNFSLLTYARAGASYNFSGLNLSGDRNEHPEDACYKTDEGRSSFVHYGVSGGYRINERWMMYTGFAMGHSWIKSQSSGVESYNPVQCRSDQFSTYGHVYTYGLGSMVKIWRKLNVGGSLESSQFYFNNNRDARTDIFLRVAAIFFL